MDLRHLKLFEGYWLQLGEDPIRASNGRPLNQRGGYVIKPPVECNDVKVILPKKSQTILDAPLGYVGLYTHYFCLSNLRLLIPPFICEVLNYFKVYISRFSPFGMVKLTTFAVMCKAYGGLKTTWKHSPKRPVIYHRGHEMDFKSFMLERVDGELNFLLAKGVSEGRNSPSAKKVASGIPKKALPSKVQKVPAQASKVASGASTPLDVDNDFDIHVKELRDAIDCHWVVAHVTPPSWKQHLREISIEQLCDIYDRAYMRQAVLDNVLNKSVMRLFRIWIRILLSLNMRVEIKVWQGQVDGLHSEYIMLIPEEKNKLIMNRLCLLFELKSKERAVVVSKVILDASIKLVRSDDLSVLIAKLVRSSIIYGRCQAFEEVAAMKEPFVLEKMSGYRPSSKEEYDQAGDALANASYPFLAEYVVNLYASLEQILSKKPPSLRPILYGSVQNLYLQRLSSSMVILSIRVVCTCDFFI
nr:hypothetical protein [Tanacetum cinerariifolium]